MAITGSLENISLPEVLQLLGHGRKTGTITITRDSSSGTIQIEAGSIVHASVREAANGEGKGWRGSGAAQVEGVYRGEAGGTPRALGEPMPGTWTPRVDEEQASRRGGGESPARGGIEEAVFALFAWSAGSFHFEPGPVGPRGPGRVALSAESLLLEAARRADERCRRVPAVPPPEIGVAPVLPLDSTGPARADLLREDFRGAASRTMRALEVREPTATAFHHLGLALEGMGRWRAALDTVEEGLQRFPGDRRLLLSRAIQLTRLGRIAEALGAFAEYERIVPLAASGEGYFVFSVLALGAARRLPEALERARRGLAVFPRSATLLLHAGLVQERAGLLEAAASRYREAALLRPDLTQARAGLARVRPESGRR